MANIISLLQHPKTHEWPTPREFFATLDKEFHFQLDAAASQSNALCLAYYDEQMDGLVSEWYPAYSSIWCNPPYGTHIGKWVAKGYEESQKGATVVMLIPARTDTAYWHDYVMQAAEIRLVRGRLRFGNAMTGAPFPSAVVVFRPGVHVPRLVAIERDGTAHREREDAKPKQAAML